jgi:hypothetical protein
LEYFSKTIMLADKIFVSLNVMKKLMFLLLTVLPCSAEVKFISDTGFIVENKIHTSKSSEFAWQTLVEKVEQWWPKDHTWWGEKGQLSIGSKAGECFCETSGDNSAEHMRISFVEKNKLMRMTGGLGPLQGMGMYGALEWQFSEVAEGTQITLSYKVTGINPDGFAQLAPIVSSVQSVQLNALKAYLDKL